MTKLLFIFIGIIFIIGFLMISIAAFWRRRGENKDLDSQYYDENGDHIYYDRSLIEKKEYMRRFPHNAKDVRRFSQLFRRKNT